MFPTPQMCNANSEEENWACVFLQPNLLELSEVFNFRAILTLRLQCLVS